MRKETIKKINKMMEGANCVIVATDESALIEGNGAMILASLASLIKSIRKNMPDEMIKDAIELGFLSDEELDKRTKESIEKLLGDTDGFKKFSEILKKII